MHIMAQRPHIMHPGSTSAIHCNGNAAWVLQQLPVWLLAAAFYLASTGAVAQQPITSPQVEIINDAGLYTLHAQHARLEQVLHNIAKATGFTLHVKGDLGHAKDSWSYQRMPIERIIKKLVRNYSTVMLYQSAIDESTSRRLDKMWIYANHTSPQNSLAQVSIEVNEMGPDDSVQPEESLDNTKIDQIDRLEGLTGPSIINSLAETLRKEPEPKVRQRAVIALDEIGGMAVLPSLEAGLSDNAVIVRIKVAQALSNIQHQQAMLLLSQMLMGDSAPQVREAAVRAMAQQTNPTAHSFLKAALQDRAENVRRAAEQVLQQTITELN